MELQIYGILYFWISGNARDMEFQKYGILEIQESGILQFPDQAIPNANAYEVLSDSHKYFAYGSY